MSVPPREPHWYDRPRARRAMQMYWRALDRMGVRRSPWRHVVVTYDPQPLDGVVVKLYVDGRTTLGIGRAGSAGAWVR